ncbi:hypothetical protein NLI96_g7693 [Meripilus lineatus]|uniref:FAS1 domain-containing protein n=1 Tax=Meripilus lineatus TaxID=2056292 RepID=A0AAD5YBT8_9APHY|nr:hypothetical protein NLI96_g7693 [Physisporinus lineatus]
MKLSISPLALLGIIPTVLAQGPNVTFINGLLETLSNRNLSAFASVAQSLNGSGVGQYLLANISNGEPHILFVPTNEALANAPSNVTSDSALLTDVIGYHIVPGNFTGKIPSFPNVTVGRTLLTDPRFVQLEGGNKAQVLVWSLRNDTTVVDFTNVGNVTIYIIDHVLSFPESFALTVPTLNASLSSFETITTQVQVPVYNATSNSTSNTTLFEALNTEWHGFTLFAPTNSAIANVTSQLQGLASNTTALEAVLFNHLINGTTYYSPQLANANFTSAAGETLEVKINGTGQFVTSGNTTAQIVQSDVLLPNGVIHIIDKVLVNTESNPSAASSALASATSAATVVVTQTEPIGFSQTAALGSPSASITEGGTKTSGATINFGNAGTILGSVILGLVGGGIAALG